MYEYIPKDFRERMCNCIGPQGNDPVCPCRMKNMTVENGRWVESVDHGPADERPDPKFLCE